MKTSFHAFAMCQSMFCAIPSPFKIWDEQARGRMLSFLPMIGLEIGLIWAGLAWLCFYLDIPQMIRGVVLAFWPYFATGGLHLDGFLDVTDAIKSCRDLQRRREILKDSHVGSFAVIACGMLLLTGFAAAAHLSREQIHLLLLLPIVSRCAASLAVTVLPPMSTSQYAVQTIPKVQVWVLSIVLLLTLGAAVWLQCWIPCAAALCGFGWTLRRCWQGLAGMNGDIAGYCLTVTELIGLLAGAVR